MIKKVKTDELRLGMFIHDLNCGWLDHPFLTNSVKIKNEDVIRKIVESGIRDVYIDTEKGLDVSDAPTIHEVNQEIEEKLQRIAAPETEAVPRPEAQVPVREELTRAREVKREATQIVHSIMEDIRLGRQMAAIVDVYDALTSGRSYKSELHPTLVLRKLFEWSEFYFNRMLVEQFIRCIGIYPVGALVALRSGWIGVVVKNGEKSLLRPVVRLLYNKKTGNYRRIPVDIDLSEPLENGDEDSIEGYELPEKWNIQPEMYL